MSKRDPAGKSVYLTRAEMVEIEVLLSEVESEFPECQAAIDSALRKITKALG